MRPQGSSLSRDVAPDSQPEITYYLSLGNSLATGAQPVSGCRDCRPEDTNEGYTSQLYEMARSRMPGLVHVNLACGGETANWMIRGHGGELPWCEYEHGTQLADAIAFLSTHVGQVAFVTIDIGGNDAALCAGLSPGTPPREARSQAQPDLQTCMSRIAPDVRKIVPDLRAAAGPTTPIVGMNYYSPSLAMWLTGSEGQQRAALITDSIAVPFNVALEAAFATGNAPVADVAGAFSTTDYTRTTDPLFGEVPLNGLRICQWTWQCSAGDLHPNREGYAVIARAFASVLFKDPSEPQDIPRAEVNPSCQPHQLASLLAAVAAPPCARRTRVTTWQ
ncbi:MAG TPA: SGNH/GDSL hydrolase family protein [Gemmatimonadaceae bacterium]